MEELLKTDHEADAEVDVRIIVHCPLCITDTTVYIETNGGIIC